MASLTASQVCLVRRALDTSELPPRVFQPTHVNRRKALFEEALELAKRGCHGYTVEAGTPVMEATKLWDPEELLAGPGIVDYVVGAAPGPGVFVLGTIEHPRQRGPISLRSGRLFLKDADAARRAQGGPLLVEVLAARRNTSIADEHAGGVRIRLAGHASLLSQIMSRIV